MFSQRAFILYNISLFRYNDFLPEIEESRKEIEDLDKVFIETLHVFKIVHTLLYVLALSICLGKRTKESYIL